MINLISVDDFKNNTRFVSNVLDTKRIDPYIVESQEFDIKDQIGDALFIDLLAYVNEENKDNFPSEYQTLLNGGIYEVDECKGKYQKSFKGLKETLLYYTWARVVKHNNYTLTRFGFTNKQDDYSKNAELKERLVEEKDALSIADKYLSDCLSYLGSNKDKFPKYNKGHQGNRLNIVIVGD